LLQKIRIEKYSNGANTATAVIYRQIEHHAMHLIEVTQLLLISNKTSINQKENKIKVPPATFFLKRVLLIFRPQPQLAGQEMIFYSGTVIDRRFCQLHGTEAFAMQGSRKVQVCLS
jgi:hypothetical protein